MKLADAAEDALRHLTETSKRCQMFEDEFCSLISEIGKTFQAREDAIGLVEDQSRVSKMLEARIEVLTNELDWLKREEITGCDMEIVCRKVVDVNGKINDLGYGLHYGTFGLYASMQHSVGQSLLAVSGRLSKVIDHEAK